MDPALIPNLGIAGALVATIFYLLTANRTDRSQFAATASGQAKRYTDELKELRDRVTALEDEIDSERDERRAAQDQAAEAERRAIAAEARAAELARIIDGRRYGDDPATARLP